MDVSEMKKFLKYSDLTIEQKNVLGKINRDFDEKSIKKVYNSFINLLNIIDDKNAIDIIKKLSTIKPVYSFQTIYNLLKEFCEDKKNVQVELDELNKYIDFDLDIFMLNNVVFD